MKPILKLLLDFAINHSTKVSFLGYICGIIWLLALAHPSVNNKTYFSENALLPGMVETHYDIHHNVKILKQEVEKHKGSTRDKVVPWLMDKMSSIGLEAYQQNFTATIPEVSSSEGTIFGSNVYGILRAPRLPSTEAIVFAVSFKDEQNVEFSELILLLSLAEHFRNNIYWAKDIIFLVVDQKELGMQSWLDEYHGITSQYIKSSAMLGRSGVIQAAINLELDDRSVNRMEVLVEGVNGQLPNLDLVNMVIRLCEMEGVTVSLKKMHFNTVNDDWDDYRGALSMMGYMMFTQASGRPSSNHGLFPKYGIEAVTLKGIKDGNGRSVGIARIGRALEGMFRSLNNLLERFHQSFFFYLLSGPHRYISIGLYMPPLGCLMLGPALLCIACWVWSVDVPQDQDTDDKEVVNESGTSGEYSSEKSEESIAKKDERVSKHRQFSSDEVDFVLVPRHFGKVFRVLFAAHIVGLLTYITPVISQYVQPVPFGLAPHDFTVACVFILFLLSLFLPVFVSLTTNFTLQDAMLLKSLALVVYTCAVGCLATVNFSFSYFLAVFTIPAFLLANFTRTKLRRFIQVIFVLIASPPLVLFVLTLVFHYFTSQHAENFAELFQDSITLFTQSILSSLRDSFLLGSWSYLVTTLLLFPNWLVFWCIAWI